MSFVLDTNVISAHLRRSAALAHRFFLHSGRRYTSSICLGELYVWSYTRSDPRSLLDAMDGFFSQEISVLNFDSAATREFGSTRAELRRQGFEVSTVDLMIASVALVHGLILVTKNTSDFERIPRLRLDDWLTV